MGDFFWYAATGFFLVLAVFVLFFSRALRAWLAPSCPPPERPSLRNFMSGTRVQSMEEVSKRAERLIEKERGKKCIIGGRDD